MNKSKGFTIPELLSVLVIIGILAVIAVSSYTGISQRVKQRALEQKINYYKEKAYEYASDNDVNEETFSLNYLVYLGYVEVDHIENPEFERIDNPVTGGFLDCMSFTAKKDLTEYTVTYDLKASCDLAANEQISEEITIERYIKRDNSYIKIEDEWVNEPVYILVKLNNYNKYTIVDNSISFNGNTNETSNKEYCSNLEDTDNALEECFNFNVIDTNYIYNAKYVVSMNLIDKSSNEDTTYRVSKAEVIKIDKELPKLKYSYDNGYTNDSIRVDLIGSDGLGSGIMGYYLAKTKLTAPAIDTYFSEDNYKMIDANGTYYAYVKDKAGNISEVEEIVVDNIDRQGPTPYISSTGRSWSTSDFTFTFGCDSDGKTGCASEVTYTIIDTTDNRNKVLANNVKANTPKVTYTVTTPNESYIKTISLKYTIKDNVGNTKTYEVEKIGVNIDKVSPELSIDFSKKRRMAGLFNCCLQGTEYSLWIKVKKQGPSGIAKYGYSASKTDINSLKNYTNEQLDPYFTTSSSYWIYVPKRETKNIAARIVSGSGLPAYGVISMNGYGCTDFAAWTIGGLILGGLIGGLIGWGICNAT